MRVKSKVFEKVEHRVGGPMFYTVGEIMMCVSKTCKREQRCVTNYNNEGLEDLIGYQGTEVYRGQDRHHKRWEAGQWRGFGAVQFS